MGTIAQELTRIQTAKTDIKNSIEAKGVQVPSNALISTYDTYIDQIQTGTTPVLTTLTANDNGTYTPGVGVDGYDEVIVNVQLPINDFSDATDLFYGGRLYEIEDKLLEHYTGTFLYETFSASSTGPTQEVLKKWMIKGIKNAELDTNKFVSFQLIMSYNTTFTDQDLTLDFSNVALNNSNVNFSLQSFCTGGTQRCIRDLNINLDNSNAGPYKLIALSPYLGQSRFRKLSIQMWTNGATSLTPAAVGYNNGFNLVVYKNVNTTTATHIMTSSYGSSDLPISVVEDSIPYYSNNIGAVVWHLPSATYDQLTQTMIDEAAQYNLTFTT